MGVPASLAMHLETLHRLIAVERVLQCASQYVVNARVAVSRGRTLIEYELWTALSFCDTAVEDVFLFPLFEHLPIGLGQVHRLVFGKSLSHCFFLIDFCKYFGTSS